MHPQSVPVPPKTVPFPQDAKRDEVVRKAYKYLAALHEVTGPGGVQWELGGSLGEKGGTLEFRGGPYKTFFLSPPIPELCPADPDHRGHGDHPEGDQGSGGAGEGFFWGEWISGASECPPKNLSGY